MILKNSKGQERNFKMLFKIEINDNIYFVYEDNITKKCYSGLKDGNKLKKIDKKNIMLLEEIIKKVNEEWKKL